MPDANGRPWNRPVTLDQLRRQGHLVIDFYCLGATGRGECGHHATGSMDDLLARYGGETAIGDVAARCSACGGDRVDIRATPGLNGSGGYGRLPGRT